MRIDIISAVPDLLASPLSFSIVKRAQDKALVEIVVHNLRDYAEGDYRKIDDAPFGGGAGMVLKIEPIAKIIRSLQAERDYDDIIYMSPDGEKFDQQMANTLSMSQNLILFAGHYKGVDQRARDMFFTREVSIGDFVLSGGELPALVITDALVRLLPGVLGDETSALFDSFQDNLLDAPYYTRPAEFEGQEIPEILLSGHEAKIKEWRFDQSLAKTQAKRPDLLGDEE